jgi:hypothetical protein
VKSRAQAKAAAISGRVKGTAVQVRDNAAARAKSVRSQVEQATPEPVRRAVTKGAQGARERWIPITVVTGILAIGYLALSQWRRRH